MKKTKKIIALFMTSALLISGLAGCSSKDAQTDVPVQEETSGETVEEGTDEESTGEQAAENSGITLGDATLKLWGSSEDQEMLQTMVDNFKALHPEANLDISLGTVSESDAKTEVLKDPAVAADVYAMASDQIAELVAAGALYRVTLNKDAIVAANSEASIQACTVDGEMYAYPSSADTYFLYYDKSKFTEEEIKSLDSILEKDLGAGNTNFSYDIDNGWYLSAFFFAAGCELFGPNGDDATICTFNDENGKAVGEFLIDLAANPKFENQDDGLLLAGFQAGTLGATASGTWNAVSIQEALGENYGVAKLPTFNLGGNQVQMSGMANFKLYGINSQTQYPVEAMALAEYLTSAECQKIRFDQRSFAPTNKTLAEDTAALSANPAVAALAEQSQYATLQASIPQTSNYWTPAEAFGAGVYNKQITKENLQENLDAFVSNVLATLN